eukprot:evm.model.scf_1230.1 EVM.evm.TU.scf_1230.1   scf_1230:18044-23677(+)
MARRGWLSCHAPGSISPRNAEESLAEAYGMRHRGGVADRWGSRRAKEQDVQLQTNIEDMAIMAEQLAIQEGKVAMMEQSNADLQAKLREMARWAEHLQQQNKELMAEYAESKFQEMEAMREYIRQDKEDHDRLIQRYNELEQSLLEAEKREGELRADQNDLVEIQHNQGQVLNETTRQLDDAKATVSRLQSELVNKEEEVQQLQAKLLAAREYSEGGQQYEEERQRLISKVSALQLQLDMAPEDRGEIQRLQGVIQEKEWQLRQREADLDAVSRRQESGRCASCSQLCEELRELRQRHHDVCDEKTQQEVEVREMKLQLSKMTPYGASPLGRIRELELQFTQKKQDACEVQRKLQAVEAERDALLEDLVAKEDQLLQQDGRLTMLSQALKQAEHQIERGRQTGPDLSRDSDTGT